jgi:hypothetical protein
MTIQEVVLRCDDIDRHGEGHTRSCALCDARGGSWGVAIYPAPPAPFPADEMDTWLHSQDPLDRLYAPSEDGAFAEARQECQNQGWVEQEGYEAYLERVKASTGDILAVIGGTRAYHEACARRRLGDGAVETLIGGRVPLELISQESRFDPLHPAVRQRVSQERLGYTADPLLVEFVRSFAPEAITSTPVQTPNPAYPVDEDGYPLVVCRTEPGRALLGERVCVVCSLPLAFSEAS